MSRYVIAIAGAYQHWEHPDTGVLEPLPTAVSVTYVPDYSWPLWHKAFGVDDLTGRWWYAQSVDVLPELTAALAYFADHRAELAALVDPQDWRGVDGNAAVLQRVVDDLHVHPDNVLAWGRE